jgi:hypothetical protein
MHDTAVGSAKFYGVRASSNGRGRGARRRPREVGQGANSPRCNCSTSSAAGFGHEPVGADSRRTTRLRAV